MKRIWCWVVLILMFASAPGAAAAAEDNRPLSQPLPREALLDLFATRSTRFICASETGLTGCLYADRQACEQRAAPAASACKAEYMGSMPELMSNLELIQSWSRQFERCHLRAMLMVGELEKFESCRALARERDAAISKYSDPIRARIRTRISIPPATPADAEVVYELTLSRDGGIETVTRISGSANVPYEAAVLKAIHAAAPFSVPSDEKLFAELRTLRIAFRAGPPPLPPTPLAAPPEPPSDALVVTAEPRQAGRVRRTFVGPRPADPVYRRYVDACADKIYSAAESNPAPAGAHGLEGHVIATIAVRADGSLESVEIERSSGHAALDNALKHFVTLAAPFPPLPDEIRREIDVLHITRAFRFGYHPARD